MKDRLKLSELMEDIEIGAAMYDEELKNDPKEKALAEYEERCYRDKMGRKREKEKKNKEIEKKKRRNRSYFCL